MHCSRSTLVKKSLLSGHSSLKGIEDYIVEVVEDVAGRETTRTLNCVVCTLPRYTQAYRTSPASETVVELDENAWTQIWDLADIDRIPSLFHLEFGKIFLRGGCHWCASDFLHEILHSRSCLSKVRGADENLDFVTEGVTELLTGWILRNRFPDCYEIWQGMTNLCFRTAYESYVRIWFYLCTHAVRIQDLLSVYLDNGLTDPLRTLTRMLHGGGLKQTRSVFRQTDPVIAFEMFSDEIHRVFKRDYADFLRSIPIRLDLSKCLR